VKTLPLLRNTMNCIEVSSGQKTRIGRETLVEAVFEQLEQQL
jgi:hypothetical protein